MIVRVDAVRLGALYFIVVLRNNPEGDMFDVVSELKFQVGKLA